MFDKDWVAMLREVLPESAPIFLFIGITVPFLRMLDKHRRETLDRAFKKFVREDSEIFNGGKLLREFTEYFDSIFCRSRDENNIQAAGPVVFRYPYIPRIALVSMMVFLILFSIWLTLLFLSQPLQVSNWLICGNTCFEENIRIDLILAALLFINIPGDIASVIKSRYLLFVSSKKSSAIPLTYLRFAFFDLALTLMIYFMLCWIFLFLYTIFHRELPGYNVFLHNIALTGISPSLFVFSPHLLVSEELWSLIFIENNTRSFINFEFLLGLIFLLSMMIAPIWLSFYFMLNLSLSLIRYTVRLIGLGNRYFRLDRSPITGSATIVYGIAIVIYCIWRSVLGFVT